MKKIELYGGKIILEFDAEKHRYFANGKRVINSATGITGIIDKSAPLMGWAVKCMAEYLIQKEKEGFVIKEETILQAKREYRSISKKAADIGTAIHEWIEYWIKGENPELPSEEKIVNGVTAFLKWQKEHKAKFTDSERLIYSMKHKYCGTLDAIAKIGKEKVIIDFKSSNGFYNEYRYQLAAYWNAVEEMGEKIDYGMIIRFGKETGEFENYIITKKEYIKDRRAFLGALAIKNRQAELKIKK